MPIWNAWYFFSLYANADGVTAGEPRAEGLSRPRPLRPGQDR